MSSLNNMTEEEEEQIAAVNKNPYSILNIKNPSEKVKLAAVKKFSWAIELLDNPTEEVQLAAVKKNGWLINYIKNPTEEAQLAALENLWDKEFYEEFIKDLPNKSEWFYRELNRLKLIKGLLK